MKSSILLKDRRQFFLSCQIVRKHQSSNRKLKTGRDIPFVSGSKTMNSLTILFTFFPFIAFKRELHYQLEII
jgi:hypothetical protein